MPEATFLIWVNTSQLGSSDEVSRLLRTQARVQVTPGSHYGEFGEGSLRFNVAQLNEEKFLQTLDDIKTTLTKRAEELGIH